MSEENTNTENKDAPKEKKQLKTWVKWSIIVVLWIGILSPFLVIRFMLTMADDGDLPSIAILENPKDHLASVVYSADGVVLGKYFRENRTNADYQELSPYLVDALIATEDERFHEHAGVDVRATGRVAKGVVSGESKGGGSTISQQLAKMLFPRESGMTKWQLVQRKFKEWIIATRLEKSYTKEEIIAMYFNKFDFLNNAVGINSAAMVYFGKKPIELDLHESAMLVGMAKNPAMFNPLRRVDTVLHRREVVLSQMLKSKMITESVYDSVRLMGLELNYTKVDHQTGLAPYFRESLRAEVSTLLNAKKEGSEEYVIAKNDGTPYDVYEDGLKIYTTIDSRLQTYAEWAVQEHLSYYLQEAFFKNNAKWKNPPFSNDLTVAQADTIMYKAMKSSQQYKKLTGVVCANCERPAKWVVPAILNSDEKTDYTKVPLDEATHHHCEYCHHSEPIRTEEQIAEIFHTPRKMKIFHWKGKNYEKDTIMSPMDSIRYYKSLLRASMVSINPKTGHVKAWVGGPYFKHFKYDMVKKGRRQVGSTFKPFVYGTAIEEGYISVCDAPLDQQYCVEVPYNKYRNKMWCPSNSGAKFTNEPMPIPFALASSMNNITAHVVSLGGGTVIPEQVFSRVEQLGVDLSMYEAVPSMALGVYDLSVYEMTGALGAFVNQGVHVEPVYLLKIEDKNGNVIYEAEQEVVKVWSANTAYTMLSIMKKVTSGIRHPTLKRKSGGYQIGGTALRIRGKETEKRPYAGIGKMPIAGKTGTTQNQSDGWFMGLTPDLVSGVWVGAEDRSVRFRSLQLGMGTNMALPIWAYYMKKVYADSTLNISQEDFEKPASIIGDPLDCFFENKAIAPIDFNENNGDGLNWQEQESGDEFDEAPDEIMD